MSVGSSVDSVHISDLRSGFLFSNFSANIGMPIVVANEVRRERDRQATVEKKNVPGVQSFLSILLTIGASKIAQLGLASSEPSGALVGSEVGAERV